MTITSWNKNKNLKVRTSAPAILDALIQAPDPFYDRDRRITWTSDG